MQSSFFDLAPDGGLEMESHPYKLRISRLTVDKLGVKLYDKVSAVVAELIANSYDADAEKVTVKLPLASHLTKKNPAGEHIDRGYEIEVIDDGHGMTPNEAIEFYLNVGRNRREHIKQGNLTRNKERPVMGRKGIGKLAPFGICRRIEVLSAGGEKTSKGYLVTHFIMDYGKIVVDSDEPIELESGPEDRTFKKQRGTIIKLSRFKRKRVPSSETFHRQIATRFAFAQPDFEVWIEDIRTDEKEKVKPVNISTQPGTRINLESRPVITEDGEELPVRGWLGLARRSYEHEELAGVRIYTREKIAAMTRDFEQPAGFTGEFTVRSYLVGQVYANWLDTENGEDLIQSHRQDIIWDSEYGRALQAWGRDIIKEIGRLSQEPRRKKSRKSFLAISNFEERARKRYSMMK